MAKNFVFNSDDSVEVVELGLVGADGKPTMTRWSLTPEQVGKHRPMFDADMSAADRAKADAIKTKLNAANQ